jgi:Protein of unknown function DUF262.
LDRIKYEIDLGNNDKGGINLKPFYQRDYKFTKKDESLLIESLLGGIPIPVIYLASDISKIPHVSNVIDGQHRLMAVYRFFNNRFALTGLKKFKQLEGLYFENLHDTIQNKLRYQISLKFESIHVQDDPELELEIFTRYNQGTNPLTPQEIRHVVFNSKANDWLIERIVDWEKIKWISDIFNINKKRFGDKSVHQEFYVMMGIFKNLSSPNYFVKDSSKIKKNVILGINQDNYSSTNYVIQFMGFARGLDEFESGQLINECDTFINKYFNFLKIVFYNHNILYPLSKELYSTKHVRNYKMQTSILMIMTSVYYWILENKIEYSTENSQEKIRNTIKAAFNKTDFATTTSSTTEPKLLIKTISTIIEEIKKSYDPLL